MLKKFKSVFLIWYYVGIVKLSLSTLLKEKCARANIVSNFAIWNITCKLFASDQGISLR